MDRRLSVHAGAPWGLDRIDTIGEPAVSGAGGARNMLAHSCPAARLSSLRWRSYRLPRPHTLVACPPDRRRDRPQIRRWRSDGRGRARVHRGHRRVGLAHPVRRPRGRRAHGEGRTSRRPHTPITHHPPTTAIIPCVPLLHHPATPSSHPSLSQARPYLWGNKPLCKPVNGILPADDYGCDGPYDGHGTHVASTVGGRTFGVAKEVTIVPVAFNNRFWCPSKGKFECFSETDVRANLECEPHATLAPPPPPPPSPPRPRHLRHRRRRLRHPQRTTPEPGLAASQPPALARSNGRSALVATGGCLTTAQSTPTRAA